MRFEMRPMKWDPVVSSYRQTGKDDPEIWSVYVDRPDGTWLHLADCEYHWVARVLMNGLAELELTETEVARATD